MAKQFIEKVSHAQTSAFREIIWSPFLEHNPLYSTSFALRHLDGWYYNEGSCSFYYGLFMPLFYFNASLKENEHILYSRGLIVPLLDELIAPFALGQFFHGRIAMSNEFLNCYKGLPAENLNTKDVRGIVLSTFLNNALIKYYMMQANARLPFNKDTELQKLFYAMVTSSFVAATFDIINIEPERGALIKENQKKLAVYYQKLFLHHIKQLASKAVETSPSFKPTLSSSSPDRISMIAGHMTGYKKKVSSSGDIAQDINPSQELKEEKENLPKTDKNSFSSYLLTLWKWLTKKWRPQKRLQNQKNMR